MTFPGTTPVRYPLAFGLKGLQHDVEPVPQVRQDMTMIVRVPVAGIQGCSRPSYKNRVRNQLLQARRRLEHGHQLGACAGERMFRS
jgi:hypothetical protein